MFASEHDAQLFQGQLLQVPLTEALSVEVPLDAQGHVELFNQTGFTPPIPRSNLIVQAALIKDQQVLLSNRLSVLVEY